MAEENNKSKLLSVSEFAAKYYGENREMLPVFITEIAKVSMVYASIRYSEIIQRCQDLYTMRATLMARQKRG